MITIKAQKKLNGARGAMLRRKASIALGFVLGAGAFATQAGQGPKPTICSRSCWGARAPQCSISQMSSLTRAIIHHTGSASEYSTNYETSKAKCRGNQSYVMDSLGYCDADYHFYVDGAGNIFEGRAGSLSSLPRGSHDGCNANSFGYAVLGNFETQSFSSAARNSLEAVIAWRQPSSWSATAGNSSYCSVSIGSMEGHYRVKATACPGDNIIAQISNMRTGVMNRKNGTATVPNPPYTFDEASDISGWTKVDMGTINWNGNSWPGVLWADQTGNDARILSPATSFTGRAECVANVSFYPQNLDAGASASHDMQLFWKTTADNTWTAGKSTPMVSYSAKNEWVVLNLNLNNSAYNNKVINQLRLDFDEANTGYRWIVNHMLIQYAPRYAFGSDTEGWSSGSNMSAIGWNGASWPGIIYADQTGNEGRFYSPLIDFRGAANDKVYVRVYPQYGSSANHDMQVFWTTKDDDSWTASKSSPIVTYTAQNAWADVYLDVGSNTNWSGYTGKIITQIRLDVDNVSSGARFIIDSVRVE